MIKTEARQRILKLALPAIATQVSVTFVHIVDTVFIGRVGVLEIGAVGLMGNLFWNLNFIGEGLAVGLTACIARMIGAGRPESCSLFLRSGLLLVGALGLLLFPLVHFSSRWIFAVIQMPGELYPAAGAYFDNLVPFLPAIYLLLAVSAAFRACGDTVTPMIVGIATNLLNVLLDWLLIFGNLGFPNMGVRGAALASGVSFSLGFLIMLLISLSRDWSPARKGPVISLPYLARIVRIGIPASIERVTMSVSQIMVMALAVNRLGGYAVTSFQIVMRLASLSFMPGMGFSLAAATLSGQCLGSREPEMASRLVWRTVSYCAIVMGGICLIYFFFPDRLIGLFTGSERIRDLTRSALRIYAALAVFLAPAMVLGGGLRGAGDTRVPMVIVFISRFGLRLPLGWLLGIRLEMGLAGVWLAMSSDFIFRAVLFGVRFARGKWKGIRI
jgi:putative MATE family efflux protein